MLTTEEIFTLAEPFGAFQYGDAQGDKRIAFARVIEHAACEDLNAEIDRLTRARDDARAEREAVQTLCDRLAGILRRTVDALRGAPPPLTLWGWYDLPERAEAMRAERDAMAKALRELLEAEGASFPNAILGRATQDAWADRKANAREQARTALAQIEQERSDGFADAAEERSTRRCPHCGLLTWEDQIEQPVDYCHHDVIDD